MGPKRAAAAAAQAAAALQTAPEEESSEDEEPEVEPEISEITVPFDATKNDMVLDFRTVSELPFDPDVSGVKAFRAFIFEKGKAVHAPNDPGKYIVAGEYIEQWSLCLVHFKPSTKRKPEFLLQFVDYAMLSPNLSGMSVESLSLPLKLKKNVYNDTPRLTQLGDVAGFSPIDASKTPWSVNLAATLKKLPLFVAHDVLMPKHLLEWLKRKPLKARLISLELLTRKAINVEVESMRKQDARQADRTAAVYLARLAKTIEMVHALPPEAYDTDERIILLAPDTDGGAQPSVITTPIRKKILDGTSELVRTQLVVRAATQARQPATTTNTIPEEVEDEDEEAAEEVEPAGEQEHPTAVELEEVEASEVTIIGGTRSRTAPTRFEIPQATKPTKKQKVVAEPAAEEAPWGINNRTGQPRKRPPYRKADKVVKEFAKGSKQSESAPSAAATATAATASLEAEMKARQREASFKETINTLTIKVLELEKDLALMSAIKERDAADAFRRGADEAKVGFTQLIIESKEEYKKGLKDGARLATGTNFSLATDRRSGYSGSGRGSSHANSKRFSSRDSGNDSRS